MPSITTSAVAGSRVRRTVLAVAKPIAFAVLLWLASAAGAVPIPGTPVPITLQTFVVMVAALTMDWRQAGAAVALYLAAGAAGLPVFAGGSSTAALFGPSAGFLIGFLPGVIVTAWLKGSSRRAIAAHHAAGSSTPTAFTASTARSIAAYAAPGSDDAADRTDLAASVADAAASRPIVFALTFLRYFAAAMVGCVAVVYVFGFAVQAALTGAPLPAIILASVPFIIGDVVKSFVASLTVSVAVALRR
ncbi:biotin biosynthesis protein BioY [Bifidobacterium biavatii DSM 23969]|uniref:Biotin biosynthesis protein BioY n=2 Tax=Bifidobacterium biavatii TaxID=762212 RepID=A0A086ZJ28_9BIFI|nr:biotin transporter BioY [Bifidobacterium biavatii]KFI46528.1 biotin biosynthesis protein BioY [Bifidobacterium biavatii DSM 23969]